MAQNRGVPRPSERQIAEFFAKLDEQHPFPEAAFRELLPEEFIANWSAIGGSQSVPWPWIMVAELQLAGFLAPNARFLPLPSMKIYANDWMAYLHMGSCHTSNLLRLFNDIYHAIERAVNEARRDAFKEAAHALEEDIARGGQEAVAAKERLHDLERIYKALMMRFGGGSLEGIGRTMALQTNRTAASGFLVELALFLKWLEHEFGVNQAIATQLWERMAWLRYTINTDKSFEMTYPFLSLLAATHVDDTWDLFASADPLGLRNRLEFFYSRPTLKRWREIKDANATLRNTGKNELETNYVAAFKPIFDAHDAALLPPAIFTYHLGYPFRDYTFADSDAEAFAAAHFDRHRDLQEEAFGEDSEAAKREGKLKGKHLRHVLKFHLLLQARSNFGKKPYPDWNVHPGLNEVKLGFLLGTYLETINAAYRAFVHVVVAADSAPGAVAQAAQNTQFARLRAIAALTLAELKETLPHEELPILWNIAAALLRAPRDWLDSTAARNMATVKPFLVSKVSLEEKTECVCRAMRLLEVTQVGLTQISTNLTSSKKLYLVKLPVPKPGQAATGFIALLASFHVRIQDYRGCDVDELNRVLPDHTRAVTAPTVDAELFQPHAQEIKTWAPQIPASSAAGAHAAAPPLAEEGASLALSAEAPRFPGAPLEIAAAAPAGIPAYQAMLPPQSPQAAPQREARVPVATRLCSARGGRVARQPAAGDVPR